MTALRVSIQSIRIRGYRSCKKTIIELDPAVTALIGPNGAGKTNILQALRLLQTKPRRIIGDDDIGETLIRPCFLEVDFFIKRKVLKYRGRFLIRQGENNTDIIVNRTDKWNFGEFGLENNWVQVIARNRPGPQEYIVGSDGRISINYDSPKLILIEQKSNERRAIQDPPVQRVFNAVREFMSSISYYSASGFTNPSLCPTSFEIGSDRDSRAIRTPSGITGVRSNAHLNFLRHLHTASLENVPLYEKYVSVVGKDGVRLIDKINWKKSTFFTTTSEVQGGGKIIKKRTKRTLLIPTVTIRGDELSFNQLSEGTFRALAIFFYILRGGREILLLEEPEVCVHHGLLDSVITVIKDVSHLKQVVLSTHSDAVIDMLNPDNLRLTRLIDSRGTSVKMLSQSMSAKSLIALKNYLVTTGTLGEYWKHSGFE